MKPIISLSVLCMLLLSACQGGLTGTFKGRIGDDIPVTFELSQIGTTLSGTYYYDKHKEYIKLKGRIDANRRIHLEGTLATEGTIDIFEGAALGEDTISGIWSKPGSIKPMPFMLFRSSRQY